MKRTMQRRAVENTFRRFVNGNNGFCYVMTELNQIQESMWGLL